MDILEWIQNWYKENCNGEWEHMFGIRIFTVDNPGWRVQIDLSNTNLEKKNFKKIQFFDDDSNWITCYIKDGIFEGGGDNKKLLEILSVFKKWAES